MDRTARLQFAAILVCLSTGGMVFGQCLSCLHGGNQGACQSCGHQGGGCGLQGCGAGCGHESCGGGECLTCDNIWDGYCESKRQCRCTLSSKLPHLQGFNPFRLFQRHGAGCATCGDAGAAVVHGAPVNGCQECNGAHSSPAVMASPAAPAAIETIAPIEQPAPVHTPDAGEAPVESPAAPLKDSSAVIDYPDAIPHPGSPQSYAPATGSNMGRQHAPAKITPTPLVPPPVKATGASASKSGRFSWLSRALGQG